MLNYNFFFRSIVAHYLWPGGRVVMQRTANPCMPVRFRPRPPYFYNDKRNNLI